MPLRISYQLFFGMIVCLISFSLFSCENKREDIETFSKKKTGIETAKGVTIIYTIGANTKSRITAPVMLRHVDVNPFIEFPNTVHADFF